MLCLTFPSFILASLYVLDMEQGCACWHVHAHMLRGLVYAHARAHTVLAHNTHAQNTHLHTRIHAAIMYICIYAQ